MQPVSVKEQIISAPSLTIGQWFKKSPRSRTWHYAAHIFPPDRDGLVVVTVTGCKQFIFERSDFLVVKTSPNV